MYNRPVPKDNLFAGAEERIRDITGRHNTLEARVNKHSTARKRDSETIVRHSEKIRRLESQLAGVSELQTQLASFETDVRLLKAERTASQKREAHSEKHVELLMQKLATVEKEKKELLECNKRWMARSQDYRQKWLGAVKANVTSSALASTRKQADTDSNADSATLRGYTPSTSGA